MVGKFVEFYGPGVSQLSIADRATISNMCPEYGATVGFFAVDDMSMKYLKQTGENYVVSICNTNKGLNPFKTTCTSMYWIKIPSASFISLWVY